MELDPDPGSHTSPSALPIPCYAVSYTEGADQGRILMSLYFTFSVLCLSDYEEKPVKPT